MVKLVKHRVAAAWGCGHLVPPGRQDQVWLSSPDEGGLWGRPGQWGAPKLPPVQDVSSACPHDQPGPGLLPTSATQLVISRAIKNMILDNFCEYSHRFYEGAAFRRPWLCCFHSWRRRGNGRTSRCIFWYLFWYIEIFNFDEVQFLSFFFSG